MQKKKAPTKKGLQKNFKFGGGFKIYWIYGIIALIFLALQFGVSQNGEEKSVSEFLEKVEKDEVKSVIFVTNSGYAKVELKNNTTPFTFKYSDYGYIQEQIDKIEEKNQSGSKIHREDKPENKLFGDIFWTIAPFILFIGIWIFIIPWNEFIFVGYSEEEDFNKYKVARTNKEGVQFLENEFPKKKVRAFELKKSDENPRENALHLDCCFQPFGIKNAIIYKDVFKNNDDVDFLINLFGEENIIFVTQEEMYDMNSNIFSISENIVVSEKGFTRLNTELRNRGFIVEEIQYSETAKMEGLLRCSTMPLKRK